MTDPSRSPNLSESMLADLPGETSYLSEGATADESDGFVAGRVVAGRYELKERLGSGGMGSVWGAHDTITGDEVAIKIMKPGLVTQPEARKRFIKEALLARKLTHEGIVKVYDVQEAEGELLIIMERLYGENLGQKLNKIKNDQQLMEVETALEYTCRIGDVLSYLHRQKVIHCDIKPDNVWINKDGSLKLLDFGISRALGNTLFQTMLHRAGGTAYYMAPEQFDSKRVVDSRADQYSLAVMLYEMLTGRIPMGRFKPAEQLRPEVSVALSEAIMIALNEAPEERYPDMSRFCGQLGAVKQASQQPVATASASVSPNPQRENPAKPNKITLYAGLLVAGLVLAGGAFWLGEASKPESMPEPDRLQVKVVPEPVKPLAKVALVPAPAKEVAAKPAVPVKAAEVAQVVQPPVAVNALVKKEAEKTVQTVEIAMIAIPGKSYELGKYEVTQGQWKAVMGSNPSELKKCGDSCPVENVSWDDIQTFLKKLNSKTGKQYLLPGEAEWEYACYGGNKTEYCGGNDLDAVGWYGKNSGDTTHAVGRKQANGYGLYDMTGNVWEWMQDEAKGWRALRGGSWFGYSGFARAAFRLDGTPANRYYYLGFRVARTLP